MLLNASYKQNVTLYNYESFPLCFTYFALYQVTCVHFQGELTDFTFYSERTVNAILVTIAQNG